MLDAVCGFPRPSRARELKYPVVLAYCRPFALSVVNGVAARAAVGVSAQSPRRSTATWLPSVSESNPEQGRQPAAGFATIS